jgi:hypothetical protein
MKFSELPNIYEIYFMKKIGDTFFIEATGDFAPGIKCIIVEMEEGRITKAKASNRDERLLKHGFLLEGEDYIIVEWRWSEN